MYLCTLHCVIKKGDAIISYVVLLQVSLLNLSEKQKVILKQSSSDSKKDTVYGSGSILWLKIIQNIMYLIGKQVLIK